MRSNEVHCSNRPWQFISAEDCSNPCCPGKEEDELPQGEIAFVCAFTLSSIEPKTMQ